MDLNKLTEQVHERYRDMVDNNADPNEWAYAWRSEYNRGGFKAVDFLMREVVDQGKCVGCAACVTICPVDVFDYVNEKPVDTRDDACVYCELCADACPVLRPTDQDLPEQIGLLEPSYDEGFGPYHYGVFARVTDKCPEFTGQDGGICSALLVHMLEQGDIEGAVVGTEVEDNPQMGTENLATTRAEILNAARSRYTYQANTVALVEAMKKNIKPIAVVGVPCQVDGVRQQQFSSIRLDVAKWYQENIKLVVGLFCSESFTEQGIESLANDLEVTKKDIKNINIKGKVVVQLEDGRVENKSLKEFGKYARPACLYCLDYAADNADIGLGGIGPDGYTFTVIRTQAGHDAWQSLIKTGWVEFMPMDDQPKAKAILAKLSKYKRNRPLPALMPTLAEREEIGNLDPKNFYKGYVPPGSEPVEAEKVAAPSGKTASTQEKNA